MSPLPLCTVETEAQAQQIVTTVGRRNYDGSLVWGITLASSVNTKFGGTIEALHEAQQWVQEHFKEVR